MRMGPSERRKASLPLSPHRRIAVRNGLAWGQRIKFWRSEICGFVSTSLGMFLKVSQLILE